MNICLASIHPRALSGQIDGLVGLARALLARGHQVRIVSAFRQADLLDGDRLALAQGDRGLLVGKLTRIRHIFAELVRQAAEVDVVHFNLPTPAFAMLGDLLQVRVRIPVVVGYEAHLLRVREMVRSGYLRAAPGFYACRLAVNNRLVARLALHRAARYVVSSRMQADELTAIGTHPTRVSVIPNVVDTSKLHPCAQEEGRKALALPDGPLVSYIGHFNHVKGVDVLVAAFGMLLRALPEARLVLAWSGVGPAAPVEAAVARDGLAERVILRGKVDVAQLLAATDVLALPYRATVGQMAFPGLLLEALTVGVPLVTSDLPLLREVVEEGRTALLCAPGDTEALARQAYRLLGDSALRRRMVAAQHATAGPFRPEALVRRYESIYAESVGDQARLLQPTRRGEVL